MDIYDAEYNPAGHAVYYVRDDVTGAEDLARAGIQELCSAIVHPADETNEADMRSIPTAP